MGNDGKPAVKIFDWTRDHPLSVLMAGGACLLFGVLAFFELEIEELPSAHMNTISILSELPGYPAQDIEKLITAPLEANLSGIKKIRKIESISTRSYSMVKLYLDWGSEMYQSSIEVRECIDRIYPYLPSGMNKPLIKSDDTAENKVILLAVKALEKENENELYPILSRDIKMRLQELDEVSFVSIQGLRKPEIHIDLDMDALSSRGLSIPETASLLSSYLVKKSAGEIMDRNLKRLVTVEGGISTVEDLQNLKLFPGTRLDTIGEVDESFETKNSLFLINGEDAWGFSIFKKAASSTVGTAESVRALLPLLEEDYKDKFSFEIIDDQSERIKKSINSLFLSLFCGLAGVLLVLTLLYKQFIPALIVACTIPYTLILNLFFLYIFHITVNMISLYGMIAAAGLIADNSIVVLHELKRGRDLHKISSALITSTLTTVIVFLPPLFIPGPTSVLFRDLVLTVIFTVLISLPVSLFLTAACCRLLYPHSGSYRSSPAPERNRLSIKILRFSSLFQIPDFYHRPLRFYHVVFLLILTCIFVFLRLIPFELFPRRHNNTLLLTSSIPADLNAEEIKKLALSSSLKLRQEYSAHTVVIETVLSLNSESALNVSPNRLSGSKQMNILLIQDSQMNTERQNSILEFCRKTLSLQDAGIQPLPGSFKRIYTENESINLTSPDLEKLYGFSLPGDYWDSRRHEAQLYYFEPDLQRLKASDLDPLTLHSELTALLEGISAGELAYGAQTINILVKASEKYRAGIHSLNMVLIGENASPLHLLGRFSPGKQKIEIYKIDQKYIRSVIPAHAKQGYGIVMDLEQVLPPGIEILSQENAETRQLVYLYSFSLVLLFLVLGVQTGNFKKTILLFSTFIPALWGGLLLLLIFMQKLNIYGFLGLLIVQGTIINSGILLLSSLDESMKKGRPFREGCRMRLRPVVGSCLSTVTALFPILIHSLLSGNGEAGLPLSITGGLSAGTLMMFIFLPAFYDSSKVSEAGTRR